MMRSATGIPPHVADVLDSVSASVCPNDWAISKSFDQQVTMIASACVSSQPQHMDAALEAIGYLIDSKQSTSPGKMAKAFVAQQLASNPDQLGDILYMLAAGGVETAPLLDALVDSNHLDAGKAMLRWYFHTPMPSEPPSYLSIFPKVYGYLEQKDLLADGLCWEALDGYLRTLLQQAHDNPSALKQIFSQLRMAGDLIPPKEKGRMVAAILSGAEPYNELPGIDYPPTQLIPTAIRDYLMDETWAAAFDAFASSPASEKYHFKRSKTGHTLVKNFKDFLYNTKYAEVPAPSRRFLCTIWKIWAQRIAGKKPSDNEPYDFIDVVNHHYYGVAMGIVVAATKSPEQEEVQSLFNEMLAKISYRKDAEKIFSVALDHVPPTQGIPKTHPLVEFVKGYMEYWNNQQMSGTTS